MYSIFSFSQDKDHGTVVYEETSGGLDPSTEEKLKGSVQDPAIRELVYEKLRQKRVKATSLSFDDAVSTYRTLSKAADGVATGVSYVNVDDGSITYKDTESLSMIKHMNLLSKDFLIKDSLSAIKWKVVGDTKKIGDYASHLAQAEVNGKSIEAWFTYDIPVSSGPAGYWGLPGLILEVTEEGGKQIVFQSASFEEPDKDQLLPPDKGKVVTQDEFKAIRDKKMEELGGGETMRVIKTN